MQYKGFKKLSYRTECFGEFRVAIFATWLLRRSERPTRSVHVKHGGEFSKTIRNQLSPHEQIHRLAFTFVLKTTIDYVLIRAK